MSKTSYPYSSGFTKQLGIFSRKFEPSRDETNYFSGKDSFFTDFYNRYSKSSDYDYFSTTGESTRKASEYYDLIDILSLDSTKNPEEIFEQIEEGETSNKKSNPLYFSNSLLKSLGTKKKTEEIIQKSAIVNKKPLEENLEIDNKVKEILQNYDLPAAPASSEMNSQTLEQNQELSKFEEEIREI